MADILELVGKLESAWVEPTEGVELGRLAGILEERQRLLAAIQSADASSLDPASVDELRRRIEAIRARDARLLGYLQNKRVEALNQLDQALNARQAVRGYQSANEGPEAGIHKIA